MAYGLRAPFEDLYAAGITGLIEAADRFDPSRGVAFTTFAYYRIRGAIIDSQRAEGRRASAPAPAFVQLPATFTAQAAANTNALSFPDPDDTSPGWMPAPVQLVPFEVLDSLEDESAPGPDEELERRRRSERVREAFAVLPDLERRVLELYYYEDESFAGISAILGMSKPWAFRLHARGLRLLREALGTGIGTDDDEAED